MPHVKLSAAALAVTIGAALTLAAGAPAAASTKACPTVATSQLFAAVGDQNEYFLAPGGSFDTSSDPWSLSGAKLVDSDLPSTVGGGGMALALPAGSSAVSPEFCVDATRPHLRFGGKADSGAKVRVDAVIDGDVVTLATVDGAAHTSAWVVSVPVPLASALGVKKGTARVQLRFTGLGARFKLDTVAVDPFKK